MNGEDMKTRHNAYASKWIGFRPRWPGDIIQNRGSYPVYPRDPDNLDDREKMLAVNAEHFADVDARTHAGRNCNGLKRGMIDGGASSGYDAWHIAGTWFPEAVLEHSQWMTGGQDEPFITTIALNRGAIDKEIMKSEIFAKNDRDMITAAGIAGHHNPSINVTAPPHRERYTRAIKDMHPILRGDEYEDWTFEIPYWGPAKLFDFFHAFRHRDGAWSNNTPLERAIDLAVRFGIKKPLDARGGDQTDVTDIYGRPVSLYDEAHEAARHVLDIATRELTLDGKTYRYRTEKGVAYLMTFFMYNRMYKNGDPEIDRERAHPEIKAHYGDDDAVAALDKLETQMLPVLADLCDWPTLHTILDNDYGGYLRAYWDNHVKPAKDCLDGLDTLKRDIIGFVPRGGLWQRKDLFERAGCDKPTYRDNPVTDLSTVFTQAKSISIPNGLHEDTFAREFDPKIFNDRNYARLGNTSTPDEDPDSKRLTAEQVAATITLYPMRHSFQPAHIAPRTLLYLDDAGSGERPGQYRFGRAEKVQDGGELSTKKDPLDDGGTTYTGQFGAEHAADLQERADSLLTDGSYAQWRAENNIGNIVADSDIAAGLKRLEGYREGLDAPNNMAIQQFGPIKAPDAAKETIGRRLIDMDCQGLVIADGPSSGLECNYLVEGALAALGQTPRPYEGGDFQFEIFMDPDPLKPPHLAGAPQKLDLMDIAIHLGLQAKYHLDRNKAPDNADLLIATERIFDLADKLTDPGRMNSYTELHKKYGKPKDECILDLNQGDPAFKAFCENMPGLPDMVDSDGKTRDTGDLYSAFVNSDEYQSFLQDKLDIGEYMKNPVSKYQLFCMIWFYHRADRQLAQDAPVAGRMRQKGVYCFDDLSLRDLNPANDLGRDWLRNLDAKQRVRLMRNEVLHVEGPQPAVR